MLTLSALFNLSCNATFRKLYNFSFKNLRSTGQFLLVSVCLHWITADDLHNILNLIQVQAVVFNISRNTGAPAKITAMALQYSL